MDWLSENLARDRNSRWWLEINSPMDGLGNDGPPFGSIGVPADVVRKLDIGWTQIYYYLRPMPNLLIYRVYLLVVFIIPSSQEMESPTNPGRFINSLCLFVSVCEFVRSIIKQIGHPHK